MFIDDLCSSFMHFTNYALPVFWKLKEYTYIHLVLPEVLLKTCVAMKFVDDDDDDVTSAAVPIVLSFSFLNAALTLTTTMSPSNRFNLAGTYRARGPSSTSVTRSAA